MKNSTHQVLETGPFEKSNSAVNLAATQDPVIWPEELLAVAEKQQLRHCLEPMLQATRKIFPTALWIKVYAETDYQYPEEKNIIFDVQVPGLRFPQSRDARTAWNAEMLRLLPAQFIFHFLLYLRLVSQ